MKHIKLIKNKVYYYEVFKLTEKRAQEINKIVVNALLDSGGINKTNMVDATETILSKVKKDNEILWAMYRFGTYVVRGK